MITSPVHLNSNIFAAVAVETTGPLVGFHDLYKICIIPLDSFYEPAKGITPFLATFKPIYEEFPWISKVNYVKAKAEGIPPSSAADVLELWFKRLPLKLGKRLCPISFNWCFGSAFIKALFGPTLFDEVFFESPRDLMSVAAYVNDCCDMNSESIPFPKIGFQSFCNRVNVIVDQPTDVLNTCRAIPQAYKASLKRMFRGVIL